MADQRQKLALGSLLTLGGTAYRLEAIEGSGGSAVVYRASYQDALNAEESHDVLIKELFPLDEHGWIYRAEDGRIICKDEGKDLMEISRSRFFMGNQINLQLLKQMPSGISGNLNSYEAYGTFYSVLSVHGGINLKQLLVEEKKAYSLKESVEMMQHILAALEAFHQHELLHLDISPDNILLLPKQVLFIDYNSVWDRRNVRPEEFVFSEKQGYSAPEIRMRNFGDIDYATDIYSACAVFFHLLMRRPMGEEEAAGTGLRRCLAGNVQIFEDVPRTAAAKAVQILLKGLHPLSRKRYPCIAAMQEDLRELKNRIDRKGISHSGLWESSFSAYKRKKETEERYLAQPVTFREKGNEISLTQEELYGRLEAGGCFLLTGSGGMGKTRFLTELWKKGIAAYTSKRPVMVYLSLKEYQETGGEAYFIRSALLKGLQFSEETAGYEDALHELEKQFDQKIEGDKVSLVLLLDGLNEAGDKQEKLLVEIEELGRRRGIGIVVTDRSDEVLSYGLGLFLAMALSPLSPKQVEEELRRNGCPLVQEEKVRELLSQPMMLRLYLDAWKAGSGEEEGKLPDTEKALIQLYLDNFCRQALRTAAGSKGKQLCIRYSLEYILPDIAAKMQKKKKTLLTFEELCQISNRSFGLLLGSPFGKAFPQYHGKSRIMMENISNEGEWYDFVVNEYLIERFGLLVQTERGYYGLLHDHFQQVLAGRAEDNQKQLQIQKRKDWRVKGVAMLAAVCVGAAGTGFWVLGRAREEIKTDQKQIPEAGLFSERGDMREEAGVSSDGEYTQEESDQIHDALVCLGTSLGKWSSQLSAQKEIAAEAQRSDVLDNQQEQARKNLEAFIRQKESYLSTLYAAPLSDELYAFLLELQEKKEIFSAERIQKLCSRYQEMEGISALAMEDLRRKLCSADSVYRTRDKRERLVQAYQDYLDAEIKYVSYELASLLAEMTPEQEEEVREVITYMEALDDFYDGPGSVAENRLDDGTKRAYEALKKAQQEMNSEGYAIDW